MKAVLRSDDSIRYRLDLKTAQCNECEKYIMFRAKHVLCIIRKPFISSFILYKIPSKYGSSVCVNLLMVSNSARAYQVFLE